jgi:hypothetical protein
MDGQVEGYIKECEEARKENNMECVSRNLPYSLKDGTNDSEPVVQPATKPECAGCLWKIESVRIWEGLLEEVGEALNGKGRTCKRGCGIKERGCFHEDPKLGDGAQVRAAVAHGFVAT